MRAADDSVVHRDAAHAVAFNEPKNRFVDLQVRADVGNLGEPSFQMCDAAYFGFRDANSNLGRATVVWTVIGDSCDRVASKALLCLFSKSGDVSLSEDPRFSC